MSVFRTAESSELTFSNSFATEVAQIVEIVSGSVHLTLSFLAVISEQLSKDKAVQELL